MKLQIFWTIIYAIALSTLGLDLLIEQLKAQNTIPEADLTLEIDDQARYLRDLETKSASDWNFTTNQRPTTIDTYQLNVSQPTIKLTEKKSSEWNNTGESSNYSVLVDVYDFTEENFY